MITAEIVYEGDYFDFRYGTKQFLDHQPDHRIGAKPTKVWALYELENGGVRFVVWTWEEAMAHGEEFSDSFDKEKPWKSPWLSSEATQEEMAKKSVLKALLKYAPKSVEGLIEAAAYADGHAIIADKFEDGGNMKLAFDVKQIAPPDAEMQELMAKVNGTAQKPEQPEPVMASNGNTEQAPSVQAVGSQPAQSAPPAKNNSATPPPPAGNARGGKGLFPLDETADMEEGVEPPNFGK